MSVPGAAPERDEARVRAVEETYARIAAADDPAIFVSLAPVGHACDRAVAATGPLAGWTLAVKDNVDVAGLPTTAACPPFAYTPAGSACAVERLERAGAVVVGKANLDQFATGLVGTRSPYGAPRNPADPALVPGGSSSGSAVAVARGLVRVALGTDTAGSGRVPAACTGIVGLKPTPGAVSVRGVVPAVPGADCVSVFARTVADAWAVLDACRGPDPLDPWSRAPRGSDAAAPARPDVVLLAGAESACEPSVRSGYELACTALAGFAGSLTEVAPDAFDEAGALLYDPAFVAARRVAFGEVLAAHRSTPGAVDPVVARVVLDGPVARATDVHRARVALAECRRRAREALGHADALVVPTVPRVPTLAEVAADPVGVNAGLGRFTQFVNLLGMCAATVPVPAPGGRPASVTVVGRAGDDALVATLAFRLQRALGTAGAEGPPAAGPPEVRLAVVGAHLRGQPLHADLLALGARFETRTRTAACYRLYALAGTRPPRPGLVRVARDGAPVEVEVYRIDPAGLGTLVGTVPAPLCIGKVELADGATVTGFLCEAHATAGAIDITSYGGWRAYLADAPAGVPQSVGAVRR
ncbi:MAG: amidase [Acidimicrobiia bacterium]|nr:MAG: amidase [Acidimicrobiia bacterium]